MNILPNQQTAIDDQTLREITLDSFRGLGYRADLFDLQTFPASSCPWHWHNEVEVFFMEQGSLIYRTPNRMLRFDKGDVGFINANILHMTKAVGSSPSMQQYHIFLPQMLACPLNSTIETRYLEPLSKNNSADLVRFSAHTTQAKDMRGYMNRAYALYTQKPFGFEIRLRNAVSELWLLLLENMPETTKVSVSHDLERVRSMVHYIETNYAEKISLEDIAGAACIGKGEGARCFKRMLHMTPFTFLISYRIDRAKEMLSHSGETVTNISLSCGFPSQNYFCKVFREKTGMTPLEYHISIRKSPYCQAPII